MKKVLLVLGLSLMNGLSACKVTEVVRSTAAADSVTTVEVTPSAFTLNVGQQLQFTATAKNASGATVAGKTTTWTSSDPSKATVSTTGVVTGISAGAALITANVSGVTMTSAVAVVAIPVSTVILTPSSSTIYVGQTTTPRLELRGPNGELLTNRYVEWTSSNTSVATVTQLGTITAIAPGTSTIRVTSENKSANYTLTVITVPVSSVSITSANNFFVGRQTQLILNLRDSVGNSLTTSGRNILWTSSNPSIASVSNIGTVSGLTVGQTTVAALVDNKLATFNLTVGLVDIDTVVISPTDSTPLSVGFTRQYTATAFDVLGIRLDATALAGRSFVWATESSTLLSMSNNGLALGVATGDATIRVSVGTKVARKVVKVIP